MDRGAWWATVHGVARSWTQLSGFTHSLTHSLPQEAEFSLPNHALPRLALKSVSIPISTSTGRVNNSDVFLAARYQSTSLQAPFKKDGLSRVVSQPGDPI